MRRSLGSIILISAMSGMACSAEPDGSDTAASGSTLSWESFRDAAYRDPVTNGFVIDGDVSVASESELRQVYDRYAADSTDESFGVVRSPLVVNRVGNSDDRWPPAVATNLTYCIERADFGANYQSVVNAMSAAARDWELTARVNFVHVVARDANCGKATNVVFNVAKVIKPTYLASAFPPSAPRAARVLRIDNSSFGNIAPYTLRGILLHELGHVLGFRHEHTRPQGAASCFEDNSWRALTSYDSTSVMHYPQCGGTNTGDLVLTALDKAGARALYP